MPFKRVKDGKTIEERGTKPPTSEEAQKSKAKEIAEQNKQRADFVKGRTNKIQTPEPVATEVATKK